MLFVRRVRNAATARRWSTNPSKVGLARHLSWWTSLGARRERVLIIEWDSSRVGYVRLRRDPDGLDVVSIALEPARQGEGIGSEAIREVVRAEVSVCDGLGWRALIDARNSSSVSAFQSAGFEIQPDISPDCRFVVLELHRRKPWTSQQA